MLAALLLLLDDFELSSGTADGTSTADATGASTDATSGTSDGTSTASAVGTGITPSTGTDDADSTAAGTGASTAASDSVASGQSTATATGASTAASTGTDDGTSTATATGASTAASTGFSTADSTATAVGLGFVREQGLVAFGGEIGTVRDVGFKLVVDVERLVSGVLIPDTVTGARKVDFRDYLSTATWARLQSEARVINIGVREVDIQNYLSGASQVDLVSRINAAIGARRVGINDYSSRLDVTTLKSEIKIMGLKWKFKRGDLYPAFECVLESTIPFDLANATAITFVWRKKGTSDRHTGLMSIVGPASDKTVKYDWVVTDTDIVGVYEAEVEVTFTGGLPMTFPNEDFFNFQINEHI